MGSVPATGSPANKTTLLYTDDHGENWTEIPIDALSTQKRMNDSPWQPTTIFAHRKIRDYTGPQMHFCSRLTVFKSLAGRVTWAPDSTGIHSSYVNGVQQFAGTPVGTLWAVPSRWNIYKQKIDAGSRGTGGVAPSLIGAKTLGLAPNPATDHATINFDASHPANSIEMLDLLGNSVRTIPVPPGAASIRMDLSGLAPGAYSLRVHLTNGGIDRSRLVVEEFERLLSDSAQRRLLMSFPIVIPAKAGMTTGTFLPITNSTSFSDLFN